MSIIVGTLCVLAIIAAARGVWIMAAAFLFAAYVAGGFK